jgi:hypothetical protein
VGFYWGFNGEYLIFVGFYWGFNGDYPFLPRFVYKIRSKSDRISPETPHVGFFNVGRFHHFLALFRLFAIWTCGIRGGFRNYAQIFKNLFFRRLQTMPNVGLDFGALFFVKKSKIYVGGVVGPDWRALETPLVSRIVCKTFQKVQKCVFDFSILICGPRREKLDSLGGVNRRFLICGRRREVKKLLSSVFACFCRFDMSVA